ncbi:methyltransferase domain-containing protein [Marinomonas rhizomae]|uniref:23S rRNA (Cytosine1962-C5)-methyltransferase n=1 Tax=Marinomonas rhizomae TaxID=491948 RepID=A0A366J118_9GAMM|nr:class I SAM-dependent methyltransferase [Marinomonas rhizomae]RBP80537.1 23S rRNA (cytosine1962-C5)-methyltransferase [Marinomonas rhizomae]RNF71772.1 methyltransferase domain-containing protein [Marinomonas rhizomae]
MDTQSFATLTEHVLLKLAQRPEGAQRLFHGRGRCFPGLEQITVDWLEGQILVSLFKEPSSHDLAKLNDEISNWTSKAEWNYCKAQSLLLQHRSRERSPTECLWGNYQEQQIVNEAGLRFQLDLGKNQNSGLFLDMRNGRRWVKENSQDKRVLNLFAYTCGFSVAAITGGADFVVNLDMAKAVLSRGRENHRLNQHDLHNVKFFAHDIFKSWGKIKKYGEYDLIIIDPPTFQRGSFALTKDYQKILRRLPELLTPNGQVLACVNDPSIPAQFLIDGMREEAPSLVYQYRLDNPPEFLDIDIESGLKALIFQKTLDEKVN